MDKIKLLFDWKFVIQKAPIMTCYRIFTKSKFIKPTFYIDLEDKQEDKIYRTVIVGRGNGDETAIENTLWLFNICINAFSDIQGLQSSVAGFKVGSGLETVVASGCYGDPPGLQMQQQTYQTMQQQGW